jgi:hypothetical protein
MNIKWELEIKKNKSKEHCFILQYDKFFCRFFYSHGLYFGYVFIDEDFFDSIINPDRFIVKEALELGFNCYKIGIRFGYKENSLIS